MIRNFFITSFLAFFFIPGCAGKSELQELVLGAARTDEYIPKIEGKNVGMLVNHTSMVNEVHLVDFLLERGISIERIFAPAAGCIQKADSGRC